MVERYLLLVLLVVSLAACGESGGTDALTHAEFVRQADAICKVTDTAVAALKAPVAPGDVAAYSAAAADLLDAQTAHLRALAPPPADVAGAGALVAASAKSAAAARDLARIAAAGDPAAIQAFVNRNADLDTTAEAAAAALGLKTCARR